MVKIAYEIEAIVAVAFSVPGLPVAQPRARHARIGNHVRTYYPNSHPIGNWKGMVIASVRDAMSRAALSLPIDGPVFVRAEFVFPAIQSSRIEQKTTKPDCDNLVKGLLDGINNSGVWKDDSIVYAIHASKRYAREQELPCTNVEIALMTPVLRPKGSRSRSK